MFFCEMVAKLGVVDGEAVDANDAVDPPPMGGGRCPEDALAYIAPFLFSPRPFRSENKTVLIGLGHLYSSQHIT